MIRLERWLAIAGVAVFSLIAVAGFALAIYAAWLFHDMPDASDLADYRPPTATRVYAWDGTLIGEFSRERRIFVPYDQIPPQLVDAFLAAEDRNFFQHGGVDVQGLGRAMTRNVLNLVRGTAAGGRLDHHPAGGQERPAHQRGHHRAASSRRRSSPASSSRP